MPWIDTSQLTPSAPLPANESEQVYNGLDCCVTLEVFNELQTLFNRPPVVYDFARALQGPALELMLRGFKVDQFERRLAIDSMVGRRAKLMSNLQRMAYAVWDKELNPNSSQQLQEFFYRHMKIPEIWTSKKGQKKLSMDRDTLEKVEIYFHAMPIVATILAIRDLNKKIQTLETEIDPDGRIRTSYNIAGTETGRWSSSANAFGTGGNLQNWENDLRRILVADDGYIIVGIDLEQAESREVGWQCGILFGDWSYLNACYAGDLHTLVCKGVWTTLNAMTDLYDDHGNLIVSSGTPWTDNKKHNRAIAEQVFYRHFTYRDMAKRGGHGTNYYGTPWTMSRHLKVPVKFMQDFQDGYFRQFPGISQWHSWTARQIQTTHRLENPFGRSRLFFGRPNDDTTLREAIAFVPQSATADRMNLGLYRVWEKLGHRVKILAQIHDAIYFQCDPAYVAEAIPAALDLINIRLTHKDRELIVPGEAKTGWNLANYDAKSNPNGLAKWKGSESRTRLSSFDRKL